MLPNTTLMCSGTDFVLLIRNSVIGLLLLFTTSGLFGQQSIDLATLSGRYGFPQSYVTTYPEKATEVAALFNLKVPVRFGTKTIWYNDFSYLYFQVTDNNIFTDSIANPLNLSGFILQTGIIQKLNENTAFQILIVPRLMTDFTEVNLRSWQLGGIFLFEKRYSERLLLRYGALYNKELFGPNIVPLVSIDFKFGDRWSLTGMFPISLKLAYHQNQNLAFGFSHFGLTTTYLLGNENYRGDYIERTSIDLNFFVRQRIGGNLHVEARLGYTLNRKYAQYSEEDQLDLRLLIFNFGDDRVQKNVNFKNGPIANLRLVYNLPIE